MRPQVRMLLGKFLIVILVFNGFVGFTPTLTALRAQESPKKRVIVVNADQPNVWTLEQAHYLLAQMHRRNLDLKAKKLEDLDPNEINGLRFDVMRQLIELGVKFDQADLAANRLRSRNQNFNAARRQTLINRRDNLREESLGLTRDISRLESDKAKATTQAEKDRLDGEIAAKKSLRDGVNEQIGFTDDELGTLTEPSGEPTSTEAEVEFNPDKLPESTFDEAFKDAARKQIERFNEAPKLNATLRLENFLQMQYEIIAKQLTLLRDEVGPGERLLFLELPQTVNVIHHEANNKWAQSWWRIVGYTKKPNYQSPRQRQLNLADGVKQRVQQTGQDDKGEDEKNTGSNEQNLAPAMTSEKVKEIFRSSENEDVRSVPISKNVEFIDLDTPQNFRVYGGRTLSINDRSVRTVELIPRQSSLNVNDMNLSVKAGAFSAVASFLFGFGAQLNVQRQREQFSQFVQQELYSSAFGKGSREFGWTFTPMPGTDRLLSGVRTTYAVVVVPEEASTLVLESNGCYFPRSAYQPHSFADTMDGRWNVENRTSRNCGGNKAFLVPIPVGNMGNADFWVEGVSYQPVPEGKRIVVLISGSNFSSQIGVLVNGISLPQAIGLAQPLIRDDSEANKAATKELENEKVRGRIERIDSNKIVFSFEMLDDFKGTPTITLVAPGKAIDINWLDDLSINGIRPATMLESPTNLCARTRAPNCVEKCKGPNNPLKCVAIADWMFGKRPVTEKFRIDSVEAFSIRGGNMKALIRGAGFTPKPATGKLFINGVERPFIDVSPSLIDVDSFPIPSEDTIQMTLVYNEDTIEAEPIANPARIRIDKVTILSYEAGDETKPGVLVVKIDGSGFPLQLNASDPVKVRVAVTSSTEAFLTITNPNEAEVVTLTDPVTEISVTTVVTRKPPPK